MKRRDFLKSGLTTLAIAGPAFHVGPVYAGSFNGRKIKHIQVRKAARRLELISGRDILKSYPMKLGQNPLGHKQFQGDKKTPEGRYYINRRNSKSKFHLSLGISYPNAEDRAFARRLGRSPGGDIMIHGQPNGKKGTLTHDWTLGCIAMSNRDMEEIWRLIPNGLPILIYA